MKPLYAPILLLLMFVPVAVAQQPGEKAGPRDYSALVKNLDSNDRELRLDAINALAEIGPPANNAVPGLVKILQEKDEELRLSAALALGKIGKDAVAPVSKLLADKDDDTRYYALAALG